VRALAFTHRLRMCNAYPGRTALEVFRGHERLTADAGAMSYETCRDFSAPLKAGDKLEVKIGEITTGTFAVSDLPANDAVMLLVVHRHDTLSTAVAFESHVFAATDGPQVAIIDTYKGPGHSKTLIMDVGKHPRSEELRYNSVVAVSPGRYQVELAGQDGTPLRSGELVALGRESYVLLRTGVEAVSGKSYPEELVVFPHSDAKLLEQHAARSHAAAPKVQAVLAALAAFLVAAAQC